MEVFKMEYNSSRPDLIIPEYGRNVHNMVAYALELADRDERNKAVSAIISVMGQLSPHLRDVEDYKHKLWDHLHIITTPTCAMLAIRKTCARRTSRKTSKSSLPAI